jgi:hypothetical protein
LLELLLQSIQSRPYILLLVFFSVIDPCDDIVELGEDRYNWNCIWLVSANRLDIPGELTIPGAILVEKIHL